MIFCSNRNPINQASTSTSTTCGSSGCAAAAAAASGGAVSSSSSTSGGTFTDITFGKRYLQNKAFKAFPVY